MIEKRLKAKAKMMRVVDEKTGESEYIPVVLLCDALKILEEKDNGARVLQKDIKVE